MSKKKPNDNKIIVNRNQRFQKSGKKLYKNVQRFGCLSHCQLSHLIVVCCLIMKCALIFAVIACAFVSYTIAQQHTTWGAVTNFQLGNETIIVSSSFGRVQNRNFTFSFVSSNNILIQENQWGGQYVVNKCFNSFYFIQKIQNQPIRGFRHTDWKRQSDRARVRIIGGGIGSRNITINLVSKRNHGLNSTVAAFG